MGGLILTSVISMGLLLVAGQQWFTDNVMMWFASADPSLELWRQVIVGSLLALAVVRVFFDNLYLRAIWLLIATGLIAAGAGYFVDNPAFIFDSMLMLSAGVCFALAAVQTGDDATEDDLHDLGTRLHAALLAELAWPRTMLSGLARRYAPYDHLPHLHYLSHLKDDPHHLSLHGN